MALSAPPEDHAPGRRATLARLFVPLAKAMLRNPILLVAMLLFAIFVPIHATLPNLKNLALASSILLLLSIGGALVMMSGNIDQSVKGTLAFTCMVAAWLMTTQSGGSGWEVPAIAAIAISVALGALIGLFNAFMVERLGFCSAGRIARFHADGFQTATAVIAAFADPVQRSAETLAAEYGAQAHADLDAMIAGAALDTDLLRPSPRTRRPLAGCVP